MLDELIVAKLRKRFPDCRFAEHFLEPPARGLRPHFLAEKAPETVTEFLGGPAEVRFENLADVHARRNAKRIQNDLHGRAIRKIRHVFLGHDARDDALVTVAASHLVADGELALHGDVDLNQLDDTRGQLVALLEFFLALFGDFAEHVDLSRSHLLDFLDFLDEEWILFVELQALEVARRNLFDNLPRQLDAFGQQALVGLFVVQVGLENFAAEKIRETLEALIREDSDFVGEVLLQLEDLRGFDGFVPLVLLSALAGEDFDVHDRALDARRAVERSIANVAGFFAEDGAEQLFFRSERGLALGRDLADKNVPGLHDRANANNTAFVEVAEEGLADVGNVASDFLGTELGIARLDFILLEVVAAPGEKRHENIAAKREFAAFGARAVGQNLTLLHAVTYTNERLLADAGVLVRALELNQLVYVRAYFAAEHAGVIGFDAHDDAFGVHLIDNAFALAEYDRAGVARGDALHACADQRRFAADERHGLALHVGTHERAVGVVVLEERDQAGGNGDELLRRNVDIVDFVAAL